MPTSGVKNKGTTGDGRYSEDLGGSTGQETRNQGILSGAKMLVAQRQRLQKLQDSCTSNQSLRRLVEDSRASPSSSECVSEQVDGGVEEQYIMYHKFTNTTEGPQH